MSEALNINGRQVGVGKPVYIVAEVSANHHHQFDQTVALLQAAKQAGADAVKLQTYTPDTLTLASDKEHFRIGEGSPWSGRLLHELYNEAYMPWQWQPKLKAIAEQLGLTLFSSAFDPSAVDFLEAMNVPAHKVASFEIVDISLIRKMARTGKPVIISTGMATLAEISEAVHTARTAGATQIALLKCTSAYPAPAAEMHLRTIPHLLAAFQVPIGLSDHTLDITVPVAAVALGACIVEKHFTLSRADRGPDSGFSLEPDEFSAMVKAIRTTESALGQVHFGASEHEAHSRVFRRSLFVVKDIKRGDAFTQHNLRSIRPGHGLHPRHLDEVLGLQAKYDVPSGTPLQWAMVENK